MRRLREQRGAVAVEFALVLPVLMLILLGITEYGLVFYDQLTLTNAAREGARSLVLSTGTQTVAETQANSAAKLVAASSGLETTSPRWVPSYRYQWLTPPSPVTTPTGCAAGVMATVGITYRHLYLTGLFGSDIVLTGKATMRCAG